MTRLSTLWFAALADLALLPTTPSPTLVSRGRTPGPYEQLLRDRLGNVGRGDHEHVVAARHIHAGTVTILEHAHRLELRERLTERGMSDAEAAPYFHDRRQSIARAVFTLADQGSDAACEPIRQVLPDYRLERLARSISGLAMISRML
jgi:hypothetical protein